MKDEPSAATFECFVKGATRYINNDDIDVSHALVRQLHGFMEMMEKRDDRYSTLQCQNPTKPNHIVNAQKLLTKY